MGSWVAINTGAIDKQITGIVTISGIGEARRGDKLDRRGVEHSLDFLKGMTFDNFAADRWMLAEKYNPVEEIGMIYPRPVLIIHGNNDAIVNIENAYDLYEAAKKPKEFFVVKGADHVFSYQRQEVIDRIMSWLT